MIFMCTILGQSPVNHGRDVGAGLLLCNLCLEVSEGSVHTTTPDPSVGRWAHLDFVQVVCLS